MIGMWPSFAAKTSDIQQTRGSDAISRIVVFATVVTLIMPENIGLTFLNPA